MSYLSDGDVVRAGATTFRVRIGVNLPNLAEGSSGSEPGGEMAFYALEKERDRRIAARKSREKKHKKKKTRSGESGNRKKPAVLEGLHGETAKVPVVKTETAVANPSQGGPTVGAPTVGPGNGSKPVSKHASDSKLNFDLAKLLEGDSSEIEKPAKLKEYEAATNKTKLPSIPGYEIIRSLGQGNVGDVVLARKEEDDKQYAIKLLYSERASDTQAVDAFFLEMRPLMDLDHNHIAKLREFGVAKDYIYVVSDYVAGINAEATMKQDGVMGVVRMAKLGCQLLHALDYAHGLGYVHKDIKPSNLLITSDGNREICVLTDFGLARAFQNSPLYGVKRKSDLETSVRFMAPEQFQNFKEMPLSVDLYSIAATFYYMLTGKYTHDFESLSFDQAVTKIKRDDAHNINRRRMDIPGELANLIHKGLERFPQKRIASAAAFRRELYKFIK